MASEDPRPIFFDQEELDRLEKQFGSFTKAAGGWLYHPSLGNLAQFKNVLDCGAGDLVWVRAVTKNSVEGAKAVKLPDDCSIEACDIDDAFPRKASHQRVVDVYVHDVNKPFPEEKQNKYDLINQSLLSLGIFEKDWPVVIQNLHDALQAGGKLNLVELDLTYESMDDQALPPAIAEFQKTSDDIFRKAGVDPHLPKSLPKLLESGGFIDFEAYRFPFPCGQAGAERLKLGQWHESNTKFHRDIFVKAANRAVELGTLDEDERVQAIKTVDTVLAEMDRVPVVYSVSMVVGTKAMAESSAPPVGKQVLESTQTII